VRQQPPEGSKEVCKVSVTPRDSYWSSACGKPVKIIEDGIGYCGVHDPAKRRETERRRQLQNAAADARYMVTRKERELIEAAISGADVAPFIDALKAAIATHAEAVKAMEDTK
jgi:hypothetical protein